uniref:Uncharacterized protein n=1 Tax=uncultured bacterium contig00073 TaxID=1181552 RepID=A0A806KKX4_9BACT|nr:hypothetical protein [uncultured bacterium contig00073]
MLNCQSNTQGVIDFFHFVGGKTTDVIGERRVSLLIIL